MDERKAHTNASLSEILKEKQCISSRITDFDIDGVVLDDETNLNIMTKEDWEAMDRPNLLPSLGRIGLFKGKLITLCGRIKAVKLMAQGNLTEEDFEVVRFVESIASFPLLLGKAWIKKDRLRRKATEESI